LSYGGGKKRVTRGGNRKHGQKTQKHSATKGPENEVIIDFHYMNMIKVNYGNQ
jgi:hypothetical protein